MKELDPKLIKPEETAEGLRWFSDPDHDLYVWMSPEGSLLRFQFCYDKRSDQEQVVEWKTGGRLGHALIHSGEEKRPHKASPLIVKDGHWSAREILRRFEKACAGVDPVVADPILKILKSS